MAALMAAAELLAAARTNAGARVVFLCQPAEELPPGGARPMIEQGALGRRRRGLRAASLAGDADGNRSARSRADDGPVGQFPHHRPGQGGHGSMPQAAVDPILAAAQIVTAAQGIVSRNVDPLKPAVLSFGTIHGGTVYNIIPSEVARPAPCGPSIPGVQKPDRRATAGDGRRYGPGPGGLGRAGVRDRLSAPGQRSGIGRFRLGSRPAKAGRRPPPGHRPGHGRRGFRLLPAESPRSLPLLRGGRRDVRSRITIPPSTSTRKPCPKRPCSWPRSPSTTWAA